MKTELLPVVRSPEPCRRTRARIAVPLRSRPAHRMPLSSSIRVRPTRTNRAYLKALRAAELAAWEQLSAPPPAPVVAATQPPVRRLLPPRSQPERDWEGWLLGLLVGCSALVLVDSFVAANARVNLWARSTNTVRALLRAGFPDEGTRPPFRLASRHFEASPKSALLLSRQEPGGIGSRTDGSFGP